MPPLPRAWRQTFAPREPAGAWSFDVVFCLRRLDSLPLHVGRIVGAAALQRYDMIDDVAGAGAARLSRRWTGMVPLEGGSGCGAAPRPPAQIGRLNCASC